MITHWMAATLAAPNWEWGFRSPSAAWLLPLGAVAAAGLAWWLYHGSTLERRWRLTLLAVRAMVLVVVLAMLFQPLLLIQAASQVRQRTLVLLDASQSMALRDQRRRTVDRAEAALALGEHQHVATPVQGKLARSGQRLHRAEASLRGQQWLALREAHQHWQESVTDLGRRLVETDMSAIPGSLTEALAAAQRSWHDQGELWLPRIEGWARESEPTLDQRQELATFYAQLREATDAHRVQLSHLSLHQAQTRLSSATGDAARYELARGLLAAKDNNVFLELEQRHALRYYSFGDALYPTRDDHDAPRSALLDVEPDRPSTQLGAALDEAVARHAGQPIAAVVLLSDGGANLGLDPLAVAQRLGERLIPIYAVGLGLPEPPDVAIAQVIAPPVAFVRDRVPLRVQLQGTDLAGQLVEVTVSLDGSVVAMHSLNLEDGLHWLDLPFSPDQSTDAGELEVRVTELADEITHTNNRWRQNLRVTDERIQVLYIEGSPRWEFRYLRQVLLRDHRLNVHLLMTEGDRDLARVSDVHLASLPSDPERLFEYDLVILGDVPATYFSQRQLEMLAELVRERGGAMAILAGPRFAPGTYADTPLAELLPVRVAGRVSQMVEDTARWRITAAGRRSTITRLVADEAANDELWRRITPMVRLPHLEGLKPGAIALAELEHARLTTADETYPLLAWQRYGSGRTLFVASDQLWRLRFRRGDEYHARFWGQAIQFLTLARVMGEASRVQITTDDTDYRAGQRVQVTAHVLGEGYEPLEAQRYQLTLEQTEPESRDRQLILEAVPGTTGLFQTSFTGDTGLFRIYDPSQLDESNPAHFRVESVSLEQIEPAMNRRLLEQLARSSGGQYLSITEVPALSELIDAPPQSVIVHRERELWSHPVLLLLLLTLLGGEWFIRRRLQQL